MAGDIFTPMPDEQIGRLALIEAIRANTDAVQRLARHTEAQDVKLDKMGETLNEMKTTIALLQNDGLKHDVRRNRNDIEDQERRILSLEAKEAERKGERGAVATIFESKLFLWLLGILSAAGAFIWGSQGGGQ